MPRTSFGKSRPYKLINHTRLIQEQLERVGFGACLKTYKHSDAERKDPHTLDGSCRCHVFAMMHDGTV